MTEDPWGQADSDLRFDWGSVGAQRITSVGGALVIVDVLSFTTTVSVAVERGVEVIPAPWRDGRAEELANETGAHLAVGRAEVTPESPWSLSPASLRSGQLPARLVLPSPNGSAIAAASTVIVVAACLRNARAVGAWLADWSRRTAMPVSVVAAGERWPDGSLRPALEDLIGAGAVIDALAASSGMRLSSEASSARTTYVATASVIDAVRGCASAKELIDQGFEIDIDVALELDACDVVPVLADRSFRRA